MKEENRLKAQERMNDSSVYKAMEQTQRVMDDYYLDGILGLRFTLCMVCFCKDT